ncbi:MAG: hypothetical protein QG610_522 [Euryarchaeota archaeon]|nr:hypothetical protein [Euryarchaeota archaeon]
MKFRKDKAEKKKGPFKISFLKDGIYQDGN